jgi:hypothetical protein
MFIVVNPFAAFTNQMARLMTIVALCQDSMVLDGDKRQALIGPD